MRNTIHTLTFTQEVRRDVPEVFAFFSQAENLETITPDWLSFKILSVTPSPVREGTLIQYNLRLRGLPLRWNSEIVEWEPPHRFVDLQLRGPYKLWRHEHRFDAIESGTRITDTVNLALPLGLAGELVYKIVVRPDVEKIFAFRKLKIEAIFS